MKKALKKSLRWLAVTIVVIIALILINIVILAIPGPFFPEEKRYRSITVYSEMPIGKEVDSIMTEVFKRLDAVPIYDPARKYNLCLCSSQQRFTFFARLTLRANRVMGLSLLGSVFVNIDFINELAERTGGQPRYSSREGSIVHVITHELMHGYITDVYGSFASRTLPVWKTEGYCEYGVNQVVAPRDIGYSIQERIDIYLDDSRWNATAEVHRPHYLWGLMMEYLINVRGFDFEKAMADSVTKEEIYKAMMDWRKSPGIDN
jgi:hypothetical protein